MIMPAGKSGHLELGYTIGKGKPGFILFDEEPERFDVMTQFATKIFFNRESFIQYLINWNKVADAWIQCPWTPGGCVSVKS